MNEYIHKRLCKHEKKINVYISRLYQTLVEPANIINIVLISKQKNEQLLNNDFNLY